MNVSKLLMSSVAALSVVGALGLANAQSTPSTSPPAATPTTPNQQMNNAPQTNGTTTTPAPGGTMNNGTVNNAPQATDPMLPAQADRN